MRKYRQVLESATEEYLRISRILDTLLFIARTENPNHRLPVESFDGSVELRKIVEFFEPMAAEAGVQLQLQGEGVVRANPTLFGQALNNLLSNALQHIGAQGSIQIDLKADTNEAVVTVSDNGSGIDPEEVPHVFARFYRTTASRNKRLPGNGLGLSIVKSILEWHGGTVELTSTLGKGTEFKLHFRA